MLKNLFKPGKLFVSKNLKEILPILLIVGVGYYIITRFLLKSMGISYFTEGFDVNKNEKGLVMLHMNGCGHCKELMPKWIDAEKRNNTGIKMFKYEIGEPEGRELADKHDVNGFPTILLLDSNKEKIKSYNEDRSTEAILNFMKDNE